MVAGRAIHQAHRLALSVRLGLDPFDDQCRPHPSPGAHRHHPDTRITPCEFMNERHRFEPRMDVQAQKLYTVRALSSTILRASSSGTSTRCSASSLRVCGQLESECGQSLSNMMLSIPMWWA